MPNDMDREYVAWIGRRDTKLRRPTYDCGCPNTGVVFYHLWCDRLACEKHADAPHDCGEFKGKSGIEEEAAELQPGPLLTLDDVAPTVFALRRRTPEDRAAYLADQRAQHVAMGAPPSWLECFDSLAEAGGAAIVMPQDASATVSTARILDETHRFTLADMEAASAAVRARREEPESDEADELDTDLRRVNDALVDALEAEGFPTFRFDNSGGTFTPHPWARITTLDGEEIYSGPVEPWPTSVPEQVTVTYAVDVSADGSGAIATLGGDGHVHLPEVSPPVDAALDHADDRPWWRRMLGGTR